MWNWASFFFCILGYCLVDLPARPKTKRGLKVFFSSLWILLALSFQTSRAFLFWREKIRETRLSVTQESQKVRQVQHWHSGACPFVGINSVDIADLTWTVDTLGVVGLRACWAFFVLRQVLETRCGKIGLSRISCSKDKDISVGFLCFLPKLKVGLPFLFLLFSPVRVRRISCPLEQATRFCVQIEPHLEDDSISHPLSRTLFEESDCINLSVSRATKLSNHSSSQRKLPPSPSSQWQKRDGCWWAGIVPNWFISHLVSSWSCRSVFGEERKTERKK